MGISVAALTVWEILNNAGLDPAPDRDRRPSWAAFPRNQTAAILATDFVVGDLLDGTKTEELALPADYQVSSGLGNWAGLGGWLWTADGPQGIYNATGIGTSLGAG